MRQCTLGQAAAPSLCTCPMCTDLGRVLVDISCLWGVVAAVFFREEANHLVSLPVPANNHGLVMGSEMIDLGLVIKSKAVVEVVEHYLRQWAQ